MLTAFAWAGRNNVPAFAFHRSTAVRDARLHRFRHYPALGSPRHGTLRTLLLHPVRSGNSRRKLGDVAGSPLTVIARIPASTAPAWSKASHRSDAVPDIPGVDRGQPRRCSVPSP